MVRKLLDFMNFLLVGEFIRIIRKITLRVFQNYIIKGFDYTNVYNLIMKSFSTWMVYKLIVLSHEWSYLCKTKLIPKIQVL